VAFWAFAPAAAAAVVAALLLFRGQDPGSTRLTVPVLVASVSAVVVIGAVSSWKIMRHLSGLRRDLKGLLESGVNPADAGESLRAVLGNDAEDVVRRLNNEKQAMSEARKQLRRLEREMSAVSTMVTRLGELDFQEVPTGTEQQLLKPIAESAIRSMDLLKDFALENSRVLSAAREKLSTCSDVIQKLKDDCVRALVELSGDSPESSAVPAGETPSEDGIEELKKLSSAARDESRVFEVGLSLEAARSGRASAESLSRRARELARLIHRWSRAEELLVESLKESAGGRAPGGARGNDPDRLALAAGILERVRDSMDPVAEQIEEMRRVLGAIESRLSGWSEK